MSTPPYRKIESEEHYKEYCDRLETLTDCLADSMNNYYKELEIEIQLLTALIEQYDDYCDMRRRYEELVMRSNLCLPAEDIHLQWFDEGLTQEYLHSVLKYCVEQNEKDDENIQPSKKE